MTNREFLHSLMQEKLESLDADEGSIHKVDARKSSVKKAGTSYQRN